ncbi:MAG: ABC transporter permease, partial [Capnocytophaga sp.]|nr:ABC transporter permease [Capnocytophaga sp.]
MIKIIRYTFFDLIRSSWTYFYLGFYLLLGIILLFINNDISKSVITMMNVITILIPLIATIFGVMYYYNSREFIELLLGQPLKRINIFAGQYIGISLSLSLSLLIGLGLPFLFYGLFLSNEIFNFLMLIITGIFLNFIFVGFSYLIGLYNENKIKGFSLAILVWLFMAVIYDGIFLLSLLMLKDYPLEELSMGMTLFNPIDLSRILILLK